MTDTTDIAALKINTYSVNSNDAWPQCADDDRTGSYVKWEDLVKLLSAQRQANEPETGFDSLKNLKFVADCCIENPDSIYASEFFLLLDEMFGKQGDYSMPIQAVAVSHLIGQLEAERQRADDAEHAKRNQYRDLVAGQEVQKQLEAELAELKSKLANPVVLPAGYSTRAGHPFHEGERNVMIPNKRGDWLSRFEVEHAIHVAGFPFTVEGE